MKASLRKGCTLFIIVYSMLGRGSEAQKHLFLHKFFFAFLDELERWIFNFLFLILYKYEYTFP